MLLMLWLLVVMLLLGSVDHCLLRHDDAAAAAVLSYQQSQVKQTYAPPTVQECSDKEKSGCTTTSSREFMNEERLQVPYTINNATSSRLDLIARGVDAIKRRRQRLA